MADTGLNHIKTVHTHTKDGKPYERIVQSFIQLVLHVTDII